MMQWSSAQNRAEQDNYRAMIPNTKSNLGHKVTLVR
jgi:hypothetical protein